MYPKQIEKEKYANYALDMFLFGSLLMTALTWSPAGLRRTPKHMIPVGGPCSSTGTGPAA